MNFLAGLLLFVTLVLTEPLSKTDDEILQTLNQILDVDNFNRTENRNGNFSGSEINRKLINGKLTILRNLLENRIKSRQRKESNISSQLLSNDLKVYERDGNTSAINISKDQNPLLGNTAKLRLFLQNSLKGIENLLTNFNSKFSYEDSTKMKEDKNNFKRKESRNIQMSSFAEEAASGIGNISEKVTPVYEESNEDSEIEEPKASSPYKCDTLINDDSVDVIIEKKQFDDLRDFENLIDYKFNQIVNPPKISAGRRSNEKVFKTLSPFKLKELLRMATKSTLAVSKGQEEEEDDDEGLIIFNNSSLVDPFAANSAENITKNARAQQMREEETKDDSSEIVVTTKPEGTYQAIFTYIKPIHSKNKSQYNIRISDGDDANKEEKQQFIWEVVYFTLACLNTFFLLIAIIVCLIFLRRNKKGSKNDCDKNQPPPTNGDMEECCISNISSFEGKECSSNQFVVSEQCSSNNDIGNSPEQSDPKIIVCCSKMQKIAEECVEMIQNNESEFDKQGMQPCEFYLKKAKRQNDNCVNYCGDGVGAGGPSNSFIMSQILMNKNLLEMCASPSKKKGLFKQHNKLPSPGKSDINLFNKFDKINPLFDMPSTPRSGSSISLDLNFDFRDEKFKNLCNLSPSLSFAANLEKMTANQNYDLDKRKENMNLNQKKVQVKKRPITPYSLPSDRLYHNQAQNSVAHEESLGLNIKEKETNPVFSSNPRMNNQMHSENHISTFKRNCNVKNERQLNFNFYSEPLPENEGDSALQTMKHSSLPGDESMHFPNTTRTKNKQKHLNEPNYAEYLNMSNNKETIGLEQDSFYDLSGYLENSKSCKNQINSNIPTKHSKSHGNNTENIYEISKKHDANSQRIHQNNTQNYYESKTKIRGSNSARIRGSNSQSNCMNKPKNRVNQFHKMNENHTQRIYERVTAFKQNDNRGSKTAQNYQRESNANQTFEQDSSNESSSMTQSTSSSSMDQIDENIIYLPKQVTLKTKKHAPHKSANDIIDSEESLDEQDDREFKDYSLANKSLMTIIKSGCLNLPSKQSPVSKKNIPISNNTGKRLNNDPGHTEIMAKKRSKDSSEKREVCRKENECWFYPAVNKVSSSNSHRCMYGKDRAKKLIKNTEN